MNTYDHRDRVALVTGGASGLGLATIEKLHACGARTASFDLAPSNAPDVLAIQGDVTNSGDLEAAVERSSESSEGSTSSCAAPASPANPSHPSRCPTRSSRACSRSTPRGRSVPREPGRSAEHGAPRVRPDRERRVACGEGRHPAIRCLRRVQGRSDRADQGDRQGGRGPGVLVNSIAPGVIWTPILDSVPKGNARLHCRPNPPRPDRPAARVRRARRVPRKRRPLFLLPARASTSRGAWRSTDPRAIPRHGRARCNGACLTRVLIDKRLRAGPETNWSP